jgi:hypothetical protein
MKKVCCMIALAAISFGSVYAAVPARSVKTTMQTDTTKAKKKKMKDSSSMKMKKDTTKKM